MTIMMQLKVLCQGVIFLLTVNLLGACGGGGSSSNGGGGSEASVVPPAPMMNLTPQAIKTFTFSWTDVSGETGYRLLENPDGSSGYSEIASVAADTESYDHRVFLPGRINASYILQACNSAGCADSAPVFVSGTLAEAIGYVKASNTDAYDYFGTGIALSGDGRTLAVSTGNEDSAASGINGNQNDNSATDSGAVYVFTRNNTGVWAQQAYIKASNTDTGDTFGARLALAANGNTLAVGAYQEDSNATGIGGNQNDNSAARSGAVYVFTRNNTGIWAQQAYIKASNTDAGDLFGIALALSGDGNTLVVGALSEDSNATGIGGNQNDNSASNSGAVYVFTRNNTGVWAQQAYIKASNTGAGDSFGWSLALAGDGNTLAVGAPSEDSNATGVGGNQTDNSAMDSSAVYVFTRTGVTWSQQAYIKASNTDAGDRFGIALTLSGDGNTLAVGALAEDSNATGIGGNQNDNSADISGAVYVFSRTGGTWSQQAYIKASNTGIFNEFGVAVALSTDGNTLAVGAQREDSNATGIDGNQNDNSAAGSGAVYVFTRSASAWSQQSYVKASNTRVEHQFGTRLALSADGHTLAVAAINESSAASGINGNQNDNSVTNSGAVYLY